MDRKEWMRREIAGWREEGIVDAPTAEKLLVRYAPASRSLSWGALLAGGFGALLIGLGIIALFAANWTCFDRPARAAIAVTPLVVCGLVALLASARGWKSRVLWEALGILWCVSTAAAACLVAQTYQVGGSAPGLILFVALLTVPIVWLSRSVAMMAAWPMLAIIWTFARLDREAASWALAFEALLFMALSLPAFIAFVRRKPGRGSLVTGSLLTGFVYSLGVAIMLIGALPVESWFGYGLSTSVFVGIVWFCSAVVALTGLGFRLPTWPFTAALVAAGAAVATAGVDQPTMYMLSLSLAIALTAVGVRKLRLSYTNVGACLFLLLVLVKFCASDVSFTIKGIVLILAGLALTALNVVFVRYRRRRG